MPPPTPSTAPARIVVGGGPGVAGLPNPYKSDQKPISFFDRFLMPFWLHFGSDFGAFWDPFWYQNRPKFRPRCRFKPYLLQKRDFSRKPIKTN